MNIFFPFKPKKGEAFRFYSGMNYSDRAFPGQTGDVSGCLNISKDGGTIVDTTNNVVKILAGQPEYAGYWYVDLTSDEMNADCVVLLFRASASDWGNCQTIVIYTGGSNSDFESEGGDDASSAQVTSVIYNLISKGYTVANISRDESGYNYYGLTPSTNGWYVIIKEKIDYTTVEYYMNFYRRVSYATAWAGRASLVYGSSINLNAIK